MSFAISDSTLSTVFWFLNRCSPDRKPFKVLTQMQMSTIDTGGRYASHSTAAALRLLNASVVETRHRKQRKLCATYSTKLFGVDAESLEERVTRKPSKPRKIANTIMPPQPRMNAQTTSGKVSGVQLLLYTSSNNELPRTATKHSQRIKIDRDVMPLKSSLLHIVCFNKVSDTCHGCSVSRAQVARSKSPSSPAK